VSLGLWVIIKIAAQDLSQMLVPQHDHLIQHSRRIEPNSLSEKALCQGRCGGDPR
jgi:predicted transcriptional regulator